MESSVKSISEVSVYMHAYILTYFCVCIQKCVNCLWKDVQEAGNKILKNSLLFILDPLLLFSILNHA